MRLFACEACGKPVYFDNSACTACGAALGFVADETRMAALDADARTPYASPAGLYPVETAFQKIKASLKRTAARRLLVRSDAI